MPTVSIFHLEPMMIGKPVHVANVDLPAGPAPEVLLEAAWVMTQNIEGSWSRGPEIPAVEGRGLEPNPDFHPEVKLLVPLHTHAGRTYGLRSSAVGDLFEIEGEAYRVASMGFEKMEKA